MISYFKFYVDLKKEREEKKLQIEKRKKDVKNRISKIYDLLIPYLDNCLKYSRSNMYRPCENDVVAIKLVNELEDLTNELHTLNDIIYGNLKFYKLDLDKDE